MAEPERQGNGSKSGNGRDAGRRSQSIEIIPSVLSADFARLGESVQSVLDAGAQSVQIDVMDGIFVPNITVGPDVVEAIARSTSARLDVHLMIDRPERYLDDFVDAGADVLTVHVEATRHPHRALQQIRDRGIEAGLALNPGTPLAAAEELLGLCHLVLLMTVNPGFGGQSFIRSSVPKIARLDARLREMHAPVRIQVDGGIDPTTAGSVVAAGARDLVAGSAVYSSGVSVESAFRRLKAAAEAALPLG